MAQQNAHMVQQHQPHFDMSGIGGMNQDLSSKSNLVAPQVVANEPLTAFVDDGSSSDDNNGGFGMFSSMQQVQDGQQSASMQLQNQIGQMSLAFAPVLNNGSQQQNHFADIGSFSLINATAPQVQQHHQNNYHNNSGSLFDSNNESQDHYAEQYGSSSDHVSLFEQQDEEFGGKCVPKRELKEQHEWVTNCAQKSVGECLEAQECEFDFIPFHIHPAFVDGNRNLVPIYAEDDDQANEIAIVKQNYDNYYQQVNDAVLRDNIDQFVNDALATRKELRGAARDARTENRVNLIELIHQRNKQRKTEIKKAGKKLNKTMRMM